MKKLTRTAAVLALGAACGMPVFAQDSSSTQSSQSSPNTTTMGAGPSDMGSTTRDDGDCDMGWIGLLGLAGLLGLRRKHNDHHHDTERTTAAR